MATNANNPQPDPAAPPETGEQSANPDLASTVYSHLRAIAQRQMQGERRGHTLTATALVHEAFLKLAPAGLAAADRAGFYLAAAQAMRRILIDHARGRNAAKRAGRRHPVGDIENVLDLARTDNLEDALALDEALSRLESEDPDAAAVVRLRFYAGLSGEQAAEVLSISPRQADREWAYARAFLLKELRAGEDRAGT